MIKAVIFDTDGMVVITEMFSVHLRKLYGIPNDILLPFFKNEFQPCLIGKADLKEEIKPYLPKWGWKGTVDEFLKFWFDAENHIDNRVVDVIGKLRAAGIKCYLATNQEKYRTEYLKNEMGFSKIFDRVFSSAEVSCKKDNPLFFDFIIKETGLNKEEVQFWDDTEKNVQVAKEYGLDARHYNNFEDFLQESEKLTNKV